MQDTKFRLIKSDALKLAETLTEDLVQPLHRLNNPRADFKMFFKFQVDKPNAGEMLQAAGTLFQMNIPFKQDEARGYAGYSKPEPGDAVVQQPQPMMMPQAQMSRDEAMERYHLSPKTNPVQPLVVNVNNKGEPTNVSLTVPERTTHVTTGDVNVSAPPVSFRAGDVHVQPAAPAEVYFNPPPLPPTNVYNRIDVQPQEVRFEPVIRNEFHAPQQPPQPAPIVNVTMPRQAPPVVNAPVTVNLPERKPVRVVRDEEGRVVGTE